MKEEWQNSRGQRGRSSVTEMYKHTLDNWTQLCTHKSTNTHCKNLKRTFLFLSHPFIVFLCLLVWVMLSSGAELSHCEQRGNQSLFTNQLSSVPGWREDTKPVAGWRVHTHTHTYTKHSHQDPLASSSCFFLLKSSTPWTQSNAYLDNHVFLSLEFLGGQGDEWVCLCVKDGAVVAMAAGWVRAVW